MPSFRSRWRGSGVIPGRLRLENHQNLEMFPSLRLYSRSAYPFHAHSAPDQFRSKKSVLCCSTCCYRSELHAQRSGIILGPLRNRWRSSGAILGRLRLENHENLEMCPSLRLYSRSIIILCTRTASRTYFRVKISF